MDHYIMLFEQYEPGDEEYPDGDFLEVELVNDPTPLIWASTVMNATRFNTREEAEKVGKKLVELGLIQGQLFIVPVSFQTYENFDQKEEIK